MGQPHRVKLMFQRVEAVAEKAHRLDPARWNLSVDRILVLLKLMEWVDVTGKWQSLK